MSKEQNGTAAPPRQSVESIAQALAAPFPEGIVRRKPQAIRSGSGGVKEALAIHYINARDVAERLDEVLGLGGWKDSYEERPGGLVLCRLSVLIGKTWVTKEDVGGESAQEGANRRKAAYSDALKRAAVKFGVGRYLYRLPQEWLPYDAAAKRFVGDTAPARPPRAKAQSAPASRALSVPTPHQANGQAPAPQSPTAPAEQSSGPFYGVTERQIQEIIQLRGLLRIPDDGWTAMMVRRGVSSARNLDTMQAQDLISKLTVMYAQKQLSAAPAQEGGLAADGLPAPPHEGGFSGGAIAYP